MFVLQSMHQVDVEWTPGILCDVDFCERRRMTCRTVGRCGLRKNTTKDYSESTAWWICRCESVADRQLWVSLNVNGCLLGLFGSH